MVACHSCVSKLIEFVFAGENNHRKNAVAMGLTLKKICRKLQGPSCLANPISSVVHNWGWVHGIRYVDGVRGIRHVDGVRGIRYVDGAVPTPSL